MTADTVGGVWTYAVELAGALAKHDVEVHLATMGAPVREDQRAAAEAAGNVTLHASTFKLEWMEDPWADVDAAGRWLMDLEYRVAPDVVRLNGYCHGACGFFSPVLMVGHSCVLSWWKAVKGEDAPASWDEYRRRVMEGLHVADHVVAPSRAMLDCLCEHYGELASTQVIYNGRSGDRFVPGAKRGMLFSALVG